MSRYNAYMRQYKKMDYKRKRDEMIEMLGGSCAECGSMERLEIDHIDRDKKQINISAVHSHKQDDREKELKNCQVLCKDCHVRKTTIERGMKPARGTHGTLSSYRYCKCDLCRKAKSSHHREYMRKRRAALKNSP